MPESKKRSSDIDSPAKHLSLTNSGCKAETHPDSFSRYAAKYSNEYGHIGIAKRPDNKTIRLTYNHQERDALVAWIKELKKRSDEPVAYTPNINKNNGGNNQIKHESAKRALQSILKLCLIVGIFLIVAGYAVNNGFGTLFFLSIPYLLPTAIAFLRKHPNHIPIFLTNIFFGWTVLGWLVAFIWAFSNPRGNKP